VRLKAAYPCIERNGVVWTYMGPRSTPPPLPELEWNMLPQSHVLVWRHLQVSNWAQGLEGNIDSSHLSFLHTRLDPNGSGGFPGKLDRGMYYNDKTPTMEVVDTGVGVMYGAGRREQPGLTYWRVTQFLMPFYGMFAPVSPSECPMQWWVPLDDHHVMKWEVRWNPERPLTEGERAALWTEDPGGFVEETADPLTHWRPAASPANDYFADFEAQRTKRFSGLPSVNLQDKAILETMLPIVDRTQEHLGTADVMIIRTRQRLIEAAKALRDHGTIPPGVDDPTVYHLRSATAILHDDERWLDAVREATKAFNGKPVMSEEANATGGRRFLTEG
jgi:phthalate 4,5-dioxygenase oxygenase subunit